MEQAMKNEIDLLRLSVEDFFTAKILKLSLFPFLITLLVMFTLFFIVAGMGLEQLGTMNISSTQTTLQNGIPHTQTVTTQFEGNAIVQYLLSFALTSWIAGFFVYVVGGFLVLYASIFIALLVIGFLTPPVLRELQRRHYPDVAMVGYSNLLEGLLLIFKWAIIMLLLFLVFIPLYFIPLVNIVAFNLPLYYFFHKMMTYDIASNICSREENKRIRFFSANKMRLKTFALYLLSLIPFAIFFGALFYVIYLGHTYFLEVRKMRVA